VALNANRHPASMRSSMILSISAIERTPISAMKTIRARGRVARAPKTNPQDHAPRDDRRFRRQALRIWNSRIWRHAHFRKA
jgi:hypothetical protein